MPVGSRPHAVASSENDIEVLKERFDWATYALHYHAAGEDAALFPAIEAKHPGVAMTFDDDHQTDDALVAEMKQLLEATNAQENLSRIARLADQLADRASLHMDKEERLLVPFVEEHFSPKVGRQKDLSPPPINFSFGTRGRMVKPVKKGSSIEV